MMTDRLFAVQISVRGTHHLPGKPRDHDSDVRASTKWPSQNGKFWGFGFEGSCFFGFLFFLWWGGVGGGEGGESGRTSVPPLRV